MISFKEATKNDIELIRELAKISWNSAYVGIISQEQIDYMLSTMYSVEEISSQMENPSYHYHLIFNEEIPAGFIGFEHHYEEKTTKLHRVYLLPEMKGKGLGKAAIELLKEKVSATTDNRIILNVNKANHAKNLYQSQGFTVYDELVLDIGDGFVMDDYVMEFRL
ncbi:MAG: GNAT family N-acetyltransferase [Flavobacteriales bacterium]|nr:GNAT family N-acetyltransferase [Flavobacteriales bacterium]